jgi:predicted nucleic acid-binding protein
MVVVSNTSPLSNLAIVGRLELLQDQFGAVAVLIRRGRARIELPQCKQDVVEIAYIAVHVNLPEDI